MSAVMNWNPKPGIVRCWADRTNAMTGRTDDCGRPSETSLGLCLLHYRLIIGRDPHAQAS
jgi:hypothetical protein